MSLSDSQFIKRAWNESRIEGLREFFNELKHIIGRNARPDQVFNIDGTVLSEKSRQTKVIVVNGSRNVWRRSAHRRFHITIVACASAACLVCPSLYILLVELVTRDVLDE